MTFREQIREWLGGLWNDFWDVPPSAVLLAGAVVLWAMLEAVWRTRAAMIPAVNLSYHAQWPLRLLLLLVVYQLLRMLQRSR